MTAELLKMIRRASGNDLPTLGEFLVRMVGHRDPVIEKALWPNPLDAPDVPPAEVLKAFLAGHAVGADMNGQIESSRNAQRALGALGLLEAVMPTPPQAVCVPIDAIQTPTGGLEPVRFGDICTTSATVEHFDGSKIVRYRTKNPPLMAVVGEPVGEGSTAAARGVALTDREMIWEQALSKDDIIVRDETGAEFVAHMPLEFDVSVEQVYRVAGRLDTPNIERIQVALAEWHERGMLPARVAASTRAFAELDDESALEKLRIASCAHWLSATATARRQAQELRAGVNAAASDLYAVFKVLAREFDTETLAFELLDSIETGLPSRAAAGGDVFTKAFLWPGSLRELLDELRSGQRPVGLAGFGAKLMDHPKTVGGKVWGRWLLRRPLPEAATQMLRAGLQFLLVDGRTKRALGAGLIRADDSLQLAGGDPRAIEASDSNEWLMLIPLA